MAKAPDFSNSQQINESLFYMWRCVIAMAHADGEVQKEEKEYLDKVIANLDRVFKLTASQKKIFEDDLKTARKVAELLPHVTRPEDRASLIYFGNILVWADGTLSAEEEEIMKKLQADQMKKVDVDKLRTEIEMDLKLNRHKRDDEMKHIHAEEQKKHPVFAALDRLMLRFGIDILD
jgi:tellurite resistance protein